MLVEKQIRILVADENPIFRRGLSEVLTARERFQVVGLANHPEDVRRKAAALRPDVVLVDVEAGRSRLELVLSLARANPDARILALGNSSEAGAVEEVFRAGASGYVLRSAEDDELWQAVEAVHRGETYLTASGRELMRRYLTRRGLGPRRGRPLTAREREVLKLVADGLSNKEIAARLRISVRTVENHRASIMRKLDLKSVVDLVKYAIACGLTQIEEG